MDKRKREHHCNLKLLIGNKNITSMLPKGIIKVCIDCYARLSSIGPHPV